MIKDLDISCTLPSGEEERLTRSGGVALRSEISPPSQPEIGPGATHRARLYKSTNVIGSRDIGGKSREVIETDEDSRKYRIAGIG